MGFFFFFFPFPPKELLFFHHGAWPDASLGAAPGNDNNKTFSQLAQWAFRVRGVSGKSGCSERKVRRRRSNRTGSGRGGGGGVSLWPVQRG